MVEPEADPTKCMRVNKGKERCLAALFVVNCALWYVSYVDYIYKGWRARLILVSEKDQAMG